MHPGKAMRLKRVIDPDHRTSIVCALDHGMTSPTFLSGLYDTGARLREAQAGGAHVIMMSKGTYARHVQDFLPTTAFAMLLTASAVGDPRGSIVTQVGTVEEAVRLGADAVVTYVALCQANEEDMIGFIARVGREAEKWGMPWIAEAEYPDAYASAEDLGTRYGFDYLIRNCRLCAEMGADIIKTNWPGDPESFEKLVRATDGVPVILAGGSRLDDETLLRRMEQARRAGAIGCSVGRNIFQHSHPEFITRALVRVLRDGWTADMALAELHEAMRGRAAV